MITAKRIITNAVFISMIYLNQSAIAQVSAENNFVVIAAVGFQESVVIGVNIPITEVFNAGIKIDRIITGGGSKSLLFIGYGVGLTTSYRISSDDRNINVVNLELSYMDLNVRLNSPSSGINYQMTFGHRNNSKGIHFVWAAGIGLSTLSNSANYLLPCLQAGVQWNM